MKHVRLSLLLIALALLFPTACVGSSDDTPSVTESSPSATENIEPLSLRLELTGEPWSEKFVTGLSGRESLEGGMLFDFQETVSYGFQMRRTLIPLSIAFVSAGGTIVQIMEMKPLTQETYEPGVEYRYAIEVNQGFFAQHGVSIGDGVVFEPGDTEGFVRAVFRTG